MASVVDALQESLQEDMALLKIVGYAIPVYFIANWFITGKMHLVIVYGVLVAALLVGLLSVGINNVRTNKREILSINPIAIFVAIIKSAIVLVPQLLIYSFIGYFLTVKLSIPIEVPHFHLIFSIVVWTVIGSVILTSYMSFAKYLDVVQGYNYKVIGESCIDVLVSLIVFLPQLALANLVLIGPVAYLYYYLFRLPFTHWAFVAYCSAAFIVNVSIFANYLAQAAYEHIKGNNDEYNENIQLSKIEIESQKRF